jgi:adenosine kinase
LGGKGSVIYHQKGETEIPAVAVPKVADPTGCGDAYRAGLLYGLEKGCDLTIAAQIASLMGAIKIGHPGPQGHSFTQDWFLARFFEVFGERL